MRKATEKKIEEVKALVAGGEITITKALKQVGLSAHTYRMHENKDLEPKFVDLQAPTPPASNKAVIVICDVNQIAGILRGAL